MLLRKLGLKQRILIVPIFAAFILAFIAFITFLMSNRDEKILRHIENKYYPSLEMYVSLSQSLQDIQRVMLDAVAALDMDILIETDSLYADNVRYLDRWLSQYPDIALEGEKVKNEYADYYFFARQVVSKMMYSDTDEELIAAIKTMTKNYNALNEKFLSHTSDNRNQIEKSFSKNRQNHNLTNLLNFLISALFILSVIIISYFVLRSITKPLGKILKTTIDFTNNKAQEKINLDSHDEIGELVQAINTMMEKVTAFTKEIEIQNWLKTGEAKLNDKMRGEQDIMALAQNILNTVVEYIHGQVGAIYLASENDRLKRVSSYAYSFRENVSHDIQFGEGLVGQAALEKKPFILQNVPQDYITIRSGLGESRTLNLLIIPFVYEGVTKGVIEIGSFEPFNDLHLSFMKQLTENISIGFNTAESRNLMQELLRKTQDQAHELENKQKDLKKSNAELKTQARILQESENKLSVQQEELRKTNEELEENAKLLSEQKEAIRKKNKELEKTQLELTQRAQELEAAYKYKSEFLANMSHELRTPLNSLLVLSRMLIENGEGNLNDKQVEYAQTINESGSDLLATINDLLDLAKVESGKMEIVYEHVSLADVASYAVRNFKVQAKQKDLDFDVFLDPVLPKSLITDKQRLNQILKNFISNSLKFTSKGYIHLDIKRPNGEFKSLSLDSNNYIIFSVSDTGRGIHKDKQNLIFEAFQQEDGTTSRKYGGTGLGLSISKQIAQNLGGDIYVQSEEGKGSTFTLCLPEDSNIFDQSNFAGTNTVKKNVWNETVMQLNPDKKNGSSIHSKSDQDAKEKNDPGTKSLLIIEDDRMFANLLKNSAKKRGFNCTVAKDGKSGLLLANQMKPSAIILDIHLPDIDGWKILEDLKENSATRHIPVHFMSSDKSSKEAFLMGAIGFLTKPVSKQDLNKALNNIEKTILKKIKNVLVVEKDTKLRFLILELLQSNDVQLTAVKGSQEAFDLLDKQDFDCIIVDFHFIDMPIPKFLKKLEAKKDFQTPIIIYTDKELNKEEKQLIQQYNGADNIIIKDAQSPEQLLAESTLFLHQVESNLPADKQKMLHRIYDNEKIFEGKKILLFDDDIRNVFALSNLLESKGAKVVVGRNGKEGLEKLKMNPDIGLVLMDIMMPEMDGYQAMGEIREQEKYKKLPIIALTAKAMKEDRAKCIDAGANDYLTKPVDQDKLLTLMRIWLYN